MSPSASISSDDSESLTPPNPVPPDAEPNTDSLQQSSSHNSGVQGLASSSASGPPPYLRNTAFDDPFRDTNAPVGFFYPNSNGMQKGLRSSTATRVEAQPITTVALVDPLPSGSNANADPFLHGMIVDASLLPTLPPQPSGLERGLQIPTRVSLITWGFSFPKTLPEQGVSKKQWRLFKHELEEFARLRISQLITIIGWHILIGHFFGLIPGLIPGFVVGWKMQKRREHENFLVAYNGGAFKIFEDRWNNEYFHPLGLHVRIEPPGVGRMDGMDISSSKLYKYQHKVGTSSPAPGVASRGGDKKEYRYQFKEGRHRMKARQKGRIIILPYKATRVGGSSYCSDQSTGVTNAMTGTSAKNFAT